MLCLPANIGGPAALKVAGTFGEVDVFQFDDTHELYAHIDYVRLDELPPFERWGEAVEPLARGDFFATTGEVAVRGRLLGLDRRPSRRLDRGGLDVPPAVRRDRLGRRSRGRAPRDTPLPQTRVFGAGGFGLAIEAPGWAWARIAVWDVAGNGAFVNPTWRE